MTGIGRRSSPVGYEDANAAELGRRPESSEEDEEEQEEYEAERASGFVPMTEVQFVLPDEMVQQPPQQAGTMEQQRGQAPPQSGMAQQQQMQQFPGGPSQSGR